MLGMTTRLSAELVGVCRAHFDAGHDIYAVAAIVGLDLDTVRRIHDVHRWRAQERRVSRSKRIDSESGQRAERAARSFWAFERR